MLPDLRQRCGNGHDPSMIPFRSLDNAFSPFRTRTTPKYILQTSQYKVNEHSDIVDQAGRYTAMSSSHYLGAPRKINPWVETEWARKKGLFLAQRDYHVVPLFPDSKTMRAPKHMGQLPPDRVAINVTAGGLTSKNFWDGRPSDSTVTGALNATPIVAKTKMAGDTNNKIFDYARDEHKIQSCMFPATRVFIGGLGGPRDVQFDDMTGRESSKRFVEVRKLEANIGGLHSHTHHTTTDVLERAKHANDHSVYIKETPWNLIGLTRSQIDERFKRGIDHSMVMDGLITDMSGRNVGYNRPPPGTIKFRYIHPSMSGNTRVMTSEPSHINSQSSYVSARKGHAKLTVDAMPEPTGATRVAFANVSVGPGISEQVRRRDNRRCAWADGMGHVDTSELAVC